MLWSGSICMFSFAGRLTSLLLTFAAISHTGGGQVPGLGRRGRSVTSRVRTVGCILGLRTCSIWGNQVQADSV